jgi:hypothetical protein
MDELLPTRMPLHTEAGCLPTASFSPTQIFSLINKYLQSTMTRSNPRHHLLSGSGTGTGNLQPGTENIELRDLNFNNGSAPMVLDYIVQHHLQTGGIKRHHK